MHILLVEDNEGDVELTQRAFRDHTPHCAVSVANDGMEALELLRKQASEDAAAMPKLILLDLNMPRMDGKKFLETVKTDPGLKTIPIIMLTSSQSPIDIRECYERHASCYVVKPFESKAFADAVRQVVHFWSSVGQVL